MRIGQRDGQVLDLAAVYLGNVGIDVQQLGLVDRQPSGDLRFLLFEFGHPHFHGRLIHAVLDGSDDACDRALDLGKRRSVRAGLRAALPIMAVQLIVVGAHRLGDGVGRDQLLGEPRQCTLLDHRTPDRSIVIAGATPVVVQAAITILENDAVASLTGAAREQAGQEEGRPPRFIEALGAGLSNANCCRREYRCQLRLSRADGLPEVVIDDAQLGHLGCDPFVMGIRSGHALAGARVFHVPEPVPDQAADVELVVEDAGATVDMPADRGVTPAATERAGNALVVQCDGDPAWRGSARKLAVDTSYDPSFIVIDAALAINRLTGGVHTLDDRVTVAEATARLAGFNAASEPAPCLVGEVFQEKGIHCPFEPDMQVADLALGQGDNLHAGERHPLEHAGDILLVAADAVECLCEHNIEPAAQGITEQGLDSCSDQRGAGHGTVLVAVHDGPALSLGVQAAQSQLILDRGLALVVGGVAGIERNAGHGDLL